MSENGNRGIELSRRIFLAWAGTAAAFVTAAWTHGNSGGGGGGATVLTLDDGLSPLTEDNGDVLVLA